jgi:hypothetical protein
MAHLENETETMTADWQPTLDQQISALHTRIVRLDSMFLRLIRENKMTRSAAEMELKLLRAALDTLRGVRDRRGRAWETAHG